MLSQNHCYHVNDFPLLNSTPGIIQDPIDLLLAKCNSDIHIGFQCLQYLCQNWVNCTLPNSDIGIGFQYLQYLCQNWVNCTLPNSDIGIGFQYYF